MVVLVTGSDGQLGQCLQFLAQNHPEIKFIFCNSSQLDITNLNSVKQSFNHHKPNFCINTAAYTAVDKAESEPEKVRVINVVGPQNLAKVCNEFDTVLLHISTDFVFDGNSEKPYTEDDKTNPTGIYGQTKLDGEKVIQENCSKYYIVRTSWVYSQFANNFMKTMLRLAGERDNLSVVNDQIGTPTNAVDLAEVILKIVTSSGVEKSKFGIYNFSNEGQCSWFDFAAEIFRVNNISINLIPIPSSAYPTPAKRPAYSVLDKTKIKEVFGSEISEEIRDWKESLAGIKL